MDLSSGKVVDSPSCGWFVGTTRIRERLLIRESYVKMYKLACEVQKDATKLTRGFIITGNPGIGKSCLLNYFFVVLMQQGMYCIILILLVVIISFYFTGKRVALRCGKEKFTYLYENGVLTKYIEEVSIEFRDDEDAWYLFDPGEVGGEIECPSGNDPLFFFFFLFLFLIVFRMEVYDCYCLISRSETLQGIV